MSSYLKNSKKSLSQYNINYICVSINRENYEEWCRLEADLKYTKDFHGLHNDHLFASE